MGNILQSFPILLSAALPDLIDDDGIPLREGSTVHHVDYRERIQYSLCPYADSRKPSGLLMNAGALRTLKGKDDIWRQVADQYRNRISLTGLSTDLALHRLSSACLYLPFAFNSLNAAPVPRKISVIFKIFRGIVFYSRHRLIHGQLNDHSSTGEYCDSNILLVGAREVCPAPLGLINSVMSDISSCLDPQCMNPLANEIDIVDTQVLIRSERIANLLNLFSICLAFLVLVRTPESKEPEGAKRIALQFPFVHWARTAARQGRRDEFLFGLRRAIDSVEVSTAGRDHVHSLLQNADSRVHQEARMDGIESDTLNVINSQLILELNYPRPPSSLEFRTTISKVLGAQLS